MIKTYAEAFNAAKTIDNRAEWAGSGGADDGCLLITIEHGPAVLAAIPGSWEDPNDPAEGLENTRIIVPNY
jgi:hypothetical protein